MSLHCATGGAHWAAHADPIRFAFARTFTLVGDGREGHLAACCARARCRPRGTCGQSGIERAPAARQTPRKGRLGFRCAANGV